MNLRKHFKSQTQPVRALHTDFNAKKVISDEVMSWFPVSPKEYVVVCVGTDRSTGDSLGPLTGTLFSESKPRHMTVYGTLHQPVHATNLHEYIDKIHSNHSNPFIIAIDACLGKTSSVGYIIADKSPLKPGAALNKHLPELGDIHLTGVVNVSGFMEYSVLQNTRLALVKDMANELASVLRLIDAQLTHQHTSPAIVISRQVNKKRLNDEKTTS